MTEPAEGQRLPVAVDVMGGDRGPEVVVEGAIRAANDLGVSSVLVGDEGIIQQVLDNSVIHNSDLISVKNATEVYTMDDVPSRAIRSKPDASMKVAFELVRNGHASGVVSPGNTGAMMAVGLFISGVMPGIARPAIATLIPKSGNGAPTVLLDSGANVDCAAYQLIQFALMGDVYARTAISCARPRVALLSNGTEKSKGCDVTRSAASTLSSLDEVNYIGYVEGRDLPHDVADVVVCDGFIGNIVLKTMEASVELVLDSMRAIAEKDLRAKVGMGLAKPALKKLFSTKLDPSAYGGAPLLGLNHIAIVCHGASNDKAIFNAIRVAKKLDDERLISHMSGALSSYDPTEADVYEDGMWDRLGHRFEPKKKLKNKSVAEEKKNESLVEPEALQEIIMEKKS